METQRKSLDSPLKAYLGVNINFILTKPKQTNEQGIQTALSGNLYVVDNSAQEKTCLCPDIHGYFKCICFCSLLYRPDNSLPINFFLVLLVPLLMCLAWEGKYNFYHFVLVVGGLQLNKKLGFPTPQMQNTNRSWQRDDQWHMLIG